MTVQCEEFEYCKVKVSYSADSELVLEKRDEVLEAVKKQNVKVPGFRQASKRANTKKKAGKKSRNSGKKNFKDSRFYETALKKQYRKYIEEQVTKELVAEAYDEVLHETKMKPIGYPDITSSKLDEEVFECEMVFMKMPDFELKEYTGFDIPTPHQDEMSNVRAQSMIQTLRERNSDTVLYGENDFLQDGDNVTLDVLSMCDGEKVETFTKNGLPYFVGRGTFQDFDHSIYGMKPGEERTFDIVFPETEDINEEIRGKRVTFTVTLNAGTKTILPALDDDFANKLGFETFDKLLGEAIGTASSQLDKEKKQLISNQVLGRILENHEFEVPAWFVLMESQNAVRSLGSKWSDMTELDIDELNKQSVKKLKLSMILDAIRDEEPEAVFSEQEVLNTIRANIENNGGNPEEVLSSAQKDGTLIGLVARLRDQATIEWLISKSTVIDESPAPDVPEQEEVTDGQKEEVGDSGVSGQVDG